MVALVLHVCLFYYEFFSPFPHGVPVIQMFTPCVYSFGSRERVFCYLVVVPSRPMIFALVSVEAVYVK